MAKIAWLIPDLLEGSGGHRTILQHADHLQQQGHQCQLYLENHGGLSRAQLQEQITKLFGYRFAEVYSGWQQIQPADMIMATIWYSARVVSELPGNAIKCYFVQDFEALFNPMGDGYIMAENSYRYGLYPITIGRWLPALLAREFNNAASHFEFCADVDTYHPLPDVTKEKAICFIHQPDKPRRCAQIGLEALGIVKHHMPDVQIYLYGSRLKSNAWFDHHNLGLLSLDECNALYNRCQAGLCISSSNPSRIPFEMMAAGLPVVEIHRDNTLYDLPPQAVRLCEPTPQSIASGLLKLLGDPNERQNMGQAGVDFMRERPLMAGLAQFGKIIDELLSGTQPVPTSPERMYPLPAYRADNFMPDHPQAPHTHHTYDQGRLAVLPPLPRKVARFIYHRLRKLWA